MAEFLTVLLAGAALLVAAGLGALLLTYLVYAGFRLLALAAGQALGGFSQVFAELEQSAEDKARHRALKDEIFARTRPQAGRIDAEFVKAAEATRHIAAALKAAKSATQTCCEVQRFTAQAQGAVQMAEVEWDPLCVALRQRVLDSLEVAAEALAGHPGFAADRQLLKQAVALRCLRQVCEICELMQYRVADVPPLCSPAASLNRQPDNQETQNA